MLDLRQVRHLVRTLGTSEKRLSEILDDADEYYETLTLCDPAKPEKPREVVNVTGAIRRLQTTFYTRLLLPKLAPSVFSHGGVRGRSIKTNAEAHSRSAHVFKTDISNFYPTVHHKRVYRIFVERFRCSPDVARLCTRLCTYRNHLALGLITSPILADQAVYRVDSRINAACSKENLIFTRFVDDITISGPFDLRRSGFEKVVTEILNDHGFRVNLDKNDFSPLGKQAAITGIRPVGGGRFDVRKEYANELERQLDDAWRLANGETFFGPYYTQGQIRGRVQFVCWVNPRRRRQLMKKFRSISWQRADKKARELGLVVSKKTLHKKPAVTTAVCS